MALDYRNDFEAAKEQARENARYFKRDYYVAAVPALGNASADKGAFEVTKYRPESPLFVALAALALPAAGDTDGDVSDPFAGLPIT